MRTAAAPPATGRPPGAAPGRDGGALRRARGPLAVAGVVALACVALRLRDPHTAGSWGFCPFLLLTGASCPACGGLRAVNDLTRGDVAAAASSNLLLVGSLPVVVALWLRSLHAAWTGRRRPLPAGVVTGAAVAALVVAVAFAVLRNLPAGAWLAP